MQVRPRRLAPRQWTAGKTRQARRGSMRKTHFLMKLGILGTYAMYSVLLQLTTTIRAQMTLHRMHSFCRVTRDHSSGRQRRGRVRKESPGTINGSSTVKRRAQVKIVLLLQWGGSDTADTYCPGLIFHICWFFSSWPAEMSSLFRGTVPYPVWSQDSCPRVQQYFSSLLLPGSLVKRSTKKLVASFTYQWSPDKMARLCKAAVDETSISHVPLHFRVESVRQSRRGSSFEYTNCTRHRLLYGHRRWRSRTYKGVMTMANLHLFHTWWRDDVRTSTTGIPRRRLRPRTWRP